RGLAGLPRVVAHDAHTITQAKIDGPRHHVGGVELRVDGRIHRPRPQRSPPEGGDELVSLPGKARSLAGGQHEGRDGHAWIGPAVSRNGATPLTRPVRNAMISAQMAMAVSSGVRAPRSRPIGARMRASPSSST